MASCLGCPTSRSPNTLCAAETKTKEEIEQRNMLTSAIPIKAEHQITMNLQWKQHGRTSRLHLDYRYGVSMLFFLYWAHCTSVTRVIKLRQKNLCQREVPEIVTV